MGEDMLETGSVESARSVGASLVIGAIAVPGFEPQYQFIISSHNIANAPIGTEHPVPSDQSRSLWW
jgi:hypothetical protein